MSKIIGNLKDKSSNDIYLDSTVLSHDGQVLNELIEEKLIGYVLYSNDEGDNGDIALNDDTSNYNYIEIFFRNNDELYSSIKIDSPDGKKVLLELNGHDDSSTERVLLKLKKIKISGTTISNQTSIVGYQASIYNDSYPVLSQKNYIYITKVIGYK